MLLVFLAIGVVAGVLSGLFGIGGGILIIPSLVFFAKFHTKLAIGTSLGAVLLPVGVLGAYPSYQQGNISIKGSLLISLGLFFGASLGARLAQTIPSPTLQRMFAVFIVLMAIRLWLEGGRGQAMADASAPVQLASADFSHGGSIPRTHSCEGENL